MNLNYFFAIDIFIPGRLSSTSVVEVDARHSDLLSGGFESRRLMYAVSSSRARAQLQRSCRAALPTFVLARSRRSIFCLRASMPFTSHPTSTRVSPADEIE